MAEAAKAAAKPLPVVDYLILPADGSEPYLQGLKCGSCGAVYVGSREHCSKCGARDSLATVRLGKTGKLYSYSIVHRSFPGVPVPYVSAIVDLDGGGTIKGNLINTDPDPAKLPFDMPVEVIFGDAQGRKDREGNSYISFFFQPRR